MFSSRETNKQKRGAGLPKEVPLFADGIARCRRGSDVLGVLLVAEQHVGPEVGLLLPLVGLRKRARERERERERTKRRRRRVSVPSQLCQVNDSEAPAPEGGGLRSLRRGPPPPRPEGPPGGLAKKVAISLVAVVGGWSLAWKRTSSASRAAWRISKRAWSASVTTTARSCCCCGGLVVRMRGEDGGGTRRVRMRERRERTDPGGEKETR